MKRARGIISPLPTIASNMETADKPLMLSGFRKLVHWIGIINCGYQNTHLSEFHISYTKLNGKKDYTIWETGIHMKRSVAVHPDIDPTNLTPSSESLPSRACKY